MDDHKSIRVGFEEFFCEDVAGDLDERLHEGLLARKIGRIDIS